MFRAPNSPMPDAASHRDRLRRLQLKIACIFALAAAQLGVPAPVAAQTVTPTAVAGATQATDLRTLVARIALYPDDVLSLVLPASTATLDVVEAARFLGKREKDASHPGPDLGSVRHRPPELSGGAEADGFRSRLDHAARPGGDRQPGTGARRRPGDPIRGDEGRISGLQ